MPTKLGTKIRRLNDEQKVVFWKALRDNEAAYKESGPTFEAVARDLTVKLGFDISAVSVASAVNLGVATWEPRISKQAKGAGLFAHKLGRLERVVRKLCAELNVPFPEDDEGNHAPT